MTTYNHIPSIQPRPAIKPHIAPRTVSGVAIAPAIADPIAAIATQPATGSTFQSGKNPDTSAPGSNVATRPTQNAQVSRDVSSIEMSPPSTHGIQENIEPIGTVMIPPMAAGRSPFTRPTVTVARFHFLAESLVLAWRFPSNVAERKT